MVFPLDGGNGILVSSKNVRDLVELYAKWIALHLATIWIFFLNLLQLSAVLNAVFEVDKVKGSRSCYSYSYPPQDVRYLLY
ncbi:hypothetical protein F5882DRAFT_472113 [Hyaloscypha sp. PMI_1271]|nr:hypothetical protein F5882DRAFT_472113 [Hyaloscypha sp. PMI_1271]